MGLVERFFRGPARSWDVESLAPPWPDDRPSILSSLRRQAAEGRSEGALPDEDYLAGPNGPRFVAGLRDRVMLVHEEPADLERQVMQVVNTLLDVTSSATKSNLRRFYDAAIEHRISDALPIVTDLLGQRTGLPAKRIERVGRWLTTGAPDRDAVKLGIALLGFANNPANNTLLIEVATHGEFTEHALDAITGTTDEVQHAAFDIARRTTGWGRVAAVEKLEGTKRPDIRRWMLLNAHWLHVYEPSRVALICAETGDLAGALGVEELTPEELLAYAALLGDLRWSDPGSDVPYMDEYADARTAALELARHLKKPSSDIRLWERVWLIAQSAREDKGIPALILIGHTLVEFAHRENWPEIGRRWIQSPDTESRSAAERAIAVFGALQNDTAPPI